MLKCIECETSLLELPFYNNDSELYVPSLPYCPNDKCKRFGLPTVVYKTEVKDAKGKRKGV